MSRAWRLCRAPYADLSGEGARLFGGRWNSAGVPLVYMSDHPALALLEVRVHLDLPPDLVPDDSVLLSIDLGSAEIETWDAVPGDPRAAGDGWVASLRTPVLRVPSVLVADATNLLVNPVHPGAAAISIAARRAFAFDQRLWLGA